MLIARALRSVARSPYSAPPRIRFLYVTPRGSLHRFIQHRPHGRCLAVRSGSCDQVPRGLTPPSHSPCRAHHKKAASPTTRGLLSTVSCLGHRHWNSTSYRTAPGTPTVCHSTLTASLASLFYGAEGNRTPDLCSAIAALSQLSYSPANQPRDRARPTGEPPSVALGRLNRRKPRKRGSSLTSLTGHAPKVNEMRAVKSL